MDWAARRLNEIVLFIGVSVEVSIEGSIDLSIDLYIYRSTNLSIYVWIHLLFWVLYFY